MEAVADRRTYENNGLLSDGEVVIYICFEDIRPIWFPSIPEVA